MFNPLVWAGASALGVLGWCIYRALCPNFRKSLRELDTILKEIHEGRDNEARHILTLHRVADAHHCAIKMDGAIDFLSIATELRAQIREQLVQSIPLKTLEKDKEQITYLIGAVSELADAIDPYDPGNITLDDPRAADFRHVTVAQCQRYGATYTGTDNIEQLVWETYQMISAEIQNRHAAQCDPCRIL